MRVIACLLLVLLVSSAIFGICNGDVWFEGYEPQDPQEIRLNMQNTQPFVSSYTALPGCKLILSEAEPQIVNLTIIVSTAALFYQDGNFETWLSIDDQEPEKLVGVFDSSASAAGQLYKRQYTVNLSRLYDNTHFIKIRVAGDYYGPEGGNYDCEGNVSVIYDYEGNVSVVIDTTPPKVSIISLENETYSAASIPLDFITNERISQSTYSLDGQKNVTINANTTLTGLSEGDHNVTIYATDEAGNIGASETIYFTINIFAPNITVLTPKNATYNESKISLNFTLNESFSELTYCLDGQENVTINGNTTLTGLPNGDHNVTIYSTDEYGNTGSSKTVYFSVDVPFPTTLVLASVIIVASAVGLLVYFKKRKH